MVGLSVQGQVRRSSFEKSSPATPHSPGITCREHPRISRFGELSTSGPLQPQSPGRSWMQAAFCPNRGALNILGSSSKEIVPLASSSCSSMALATAWISRSRTSARAAVTDGRPSEDTERHARDAAPIRAIVLPPPRVDLPAPRRKLDNIGPTFVEMRANAAECV